MRERRFFPALLTVTAAGGALYSLAAVFMLAGDGAGRLFPALLLFYAPVVFLLNALFLRRSRIASRVVFFELFLFAAGLLPAALTDGFSGAIGFVFTALFVAVPVALSLRLLNEGLDLNTLILLCDANAALLLLFLAYVTLRGEALRLLLPAALAFALSLWSMILFRAGAETRGRGVFPAVLGIGVSAMLMLAALLAAVPAGRGLLALRDAVLAALRSVARLLDKLLLFLFSLFPDAEPLQLPESAAALPQQAASEEIILPLWMERALVIAAVAAGIMLLLLLLRVLKNTSLGGERQSISVWERRSIPLSAGLRRALARLLAAFRLRFFLLRHRNEALGLFYRLERRYHRAPGETPAEFLGRLGTSGELAPYTDALLPAVNEALYTRSHVSAPFPDAKKLRRALRRARRQK